MKSIIKRNFALLASVWAFVTIAVNASANDKLDAASPFYFDGSISRETLENYLDRSVTAGYFLVPGTPENYQFPYRDDDVRMLRNIGAKFIGRAIYRWSEESKLGDPTFLDYARQRIERMHSYDPEIIFQGCLFEHVSADANNLKIPAWVFAAFGQPAEDRNFRVDDMIKRATAGAETLMRSRGGGSPIINNLETKMWFYYLAKSYIDIGCEAFHLGQVEVIGRDDPDKTHYAEMIRMIRDYARRHARRHYVVLDGHTPRHGFVKDGISLLDFNSFPLRIKEVAGRPMEGELEVGYSDGIYKKSLPAIAPSGWKAESMPYLVEFDNFGIRQDPPPGVANPNDHFCWGYDEITWFALQSEDYRNKWLRYAFDWIKKTDPNGHLQMCVTRMISGPAAAKTLRSYFANTNSDACPVGYSQEETIKQIWNSHLKTRANAALQGDMVIRLNAKPDDLRTNPLPVGNGHIGALVYGKIQDERIALNESSFWSGRPHDYNDPAAGKYYNTIKTLVFNDHFKEAESLIDNYFYGKPASQQAYQPLGDLRLFFYGIDTDVFRDRSYQRELDMETGVTSVSFVCDGVKYTREVFVSYPDRVLVVQISADKPGAISLDVSLDSHFTDNIAAVPNRLTLDGSWEGPLPTYWLIGEVDGKGLKFRTEVRAKTVGGESSVKKDKLVIRKADAVTLTLAAATSFVNYKDISGDPVVACQKTLEAAADKDYAALRRRHIDDFSGLMGKVHLNVGEQSVKSFNERLQSVLDGQPDANFEALCFQFGRYLLASSSRPGGQPANLQAIWNEKLTPPWGSKYTININTQMNYWPAEVCNLSECHLPLVEMVKDISEAGAKTAQVYYGAKGWVTHHNLDLWRGTAPVDAARFGMWPVGGAWLCRHLWEHYAFSGDKTLLKEYYPILKGAAEFLTDILVEHPKYGYLVTPVSMSPEHGYYADESSNELSYISPGPTMDVGIMRDLFPQVIEASKQLGVDAPLRKQLENILKRLPPYKVNRLGYVQEWIEDWLPQRGGHDVSPYFPFYPGNSILLHRESDLELVNAYRYWLESRGLRGGGFPGSWNICMWARLERGDMVSALVNAAAGATAGHILRQGTGAQVDAPFGFAAGIAEALLQSHAGEISLLPALPTAWSAAGEVTGLRARGGYTVSMKWEKGRLTAAEISHPDGGACTVRYNGGVHKIVVPKGGAHRIFIQ